MEASNVRVAAELLRQGNGVTICQGMHEGGEIVSGDRMLIFRWALSRDTEDVPVNIQSRAMDGGQVDDKQRTIVDVYDVSDRGPMGPTCVQRQDL